MGQNEITIQIYIIVSVVVILVIINIFSKKFGIEAKDIESGTFLPVFKKVAERLGLTQVELNREARKERVAHIARLRSSFSVIRHIRSVFSGEVRGVPIELIDIGKGKSTVQETFVALSVENFDDRLWLTCTTLPHLFGLKEIYGFHRPLSDSTLMPMHTFYKARDPGHPIFAALSKDDISRLNSIAEEYKVFEVIMEKGKFYFLMELTKMYKGRGLILDSKKYPQTVVDIVELALELREIFVRAFESSQVNNI